MIEDLNLDPLPDLPPELAELDAELRDLCIAERPSFGPELEAELERAWQLGPEPETSSFAGTRRALAASIGAILFAGMLVPPARAAIAEISRQSLRLLGVVEQPTTSTSSRDVPPAGRAFDLAPVVPRDPVRPPSSRAAPGSGEVPDSEGASPREAPSPELPRFEPVDVTYPELIDRNADEEAIRRYYPGDLQEQGIGGSVFLRLWVDSSGAVDDIEVRRGSGYPEMDRAARRAARELRFHPATRDGRPVGTMVELPMDFEPVVKSRPLPDVQPVRRPELPEGYAGIPPAWSGESVVPAPFQVETRELLRTAMGRGTNLESRFGSVDNLLAGEPPAGVSPLRWRAAAGEALEEASVRDPDNPAPYLALGRIRKRQGLRSDALALFEEGLRMARRGTRAVPPALVAELAYEQGMIRKDAWLAWKDLGRVSPEVVAGARCPLEHGTSPDPDDLIALDYLCPAELDRVMREGFTATAPDQPLREDMLSSFEAAVAAYPGHVGANVELLLDLADRGQWYRMLNDARRFAWASQGHPYALLLSGLALHRMGRSDEAMDDFELALGGLPDEEARLLTDVRPLLPDDGRRDLEGLRGEDRRKAEATFWRRLDPILLTDVNERRVEHLARASYAWLRFGGTDTEAGDVWVRYGRPRTVRTLGVGTGLRTEFWDYGRGPDLTFRRPAVSSDMDLTAEGRAYLEEVGQNLLHRYGRQSRLVAPLEAQVGRFQDPGGQAGQVTVATRVPAALATGPEDSLSIGLFVLGPDAERISETRRVIPAREATVRMGAPVPSGAAEVVLELYHPGLGQAAVVRSPVYRDRSNGEDPRVSDVLLVEPATPLTRDIRRDEAWLIPRTDPRDASGPNVGLLFELYDVPPAGAYYRMRVELDPRGGGRTIPVSYRPSGTERFGLEWPRRSGGKGPITEFLTLDLHDVAPGSYTLRLTVDLPGAGHPILLERAVQR